jgi:asparagine synthase (glutamine-hydrolysing)
MRRATIALESRLRADRRGKRFPASRADEILQMRGLDAYKHLLAFFPDAEKQDMLMPDFRAAIGASHTTAYLEKHFERPGDDVVNRYLALDMTTYLPEDILFKVDIASMANSLECRSPFLDHRLIEFAASLPGHYKLSAAGRHKHILKEAFKDWLPAGFMDRPKKGFSVPLSRWLKEDLADMLRDTLVDKRTLAPWFRQEITERYVAEHLSGRGSHSTRLWPLLVLALWVERFRVPI